MVVGILQIEVSIDGSTSLKDKRRVVSSLKDRLHREHQVSVAEVDLLERRFLKNRLLEHYKIPRLSLFYL